MLSRLARGGAAVAISGALVFAMPIAAQAETPVGVLKFLANVATFGGASGVGVKAAAPVVVEGAGMACAAALPVCAGVAVAVVGAALYMTQDTWVPWFTNGAAVEGYPLMTVFGPDGNNVAVRISQNSPLLGSVDGPFQIEGNRWDPSHAASGPQNLYVVGEITYVDAAGVSQTVSYQPAGQTLSWDRGWIPYGWWAPPAGARVTGLSGYVAPTGSDGTAAVRYSWGQPVEPTVASLQVQCVNPNGSTYQVTSAVPSAGGLVQAPTCNGAPGDLGGARGKCVTLSAGQSMSALSVQSSNCVVAAASEAQYPNCATGPGCSYMVIVDGVPCTVGRPGCSDWTRTYQQAPGRVGCRYGEYAVRVSSCFFLERIYEASGAPVDGTLANTDGEPATWTGDTPAPLPQPGTAPIPNGAPGGAPGTLPGGGGAPLPSPSANPQTNSDCWSGAAFSWNPVDWVMVPVKCALSWAFVPSSGFLADWGNGMRANWSASPPGLWINSVGALVPVITSSGCQGPALPTGFMGQGWSTGPLTVAGPSPLPAVLHPFDACSGVMATAAATSYLILSAGIAFYGGMKVVRQLGYAFGFQIHVGSERSTFT